MWPLIADFYTPLLALLVCRIAYLSGYLKPVLILLVVSLLLVFGFSALELRLGLWRSWGLDYSTHTAILLPFYQILFVLALLPGDATEADKTGFKLTIPHLKALLTLIVAVVSGVGYGLLMMKLDYHTFGDILTTVISTYPLVWVCFHLTRPLLRAHQAKQGA